MSSVTKASLMKDYGPASSIAGEREILCDRIIIATFIGAALITYLGIFIGVGRDVHDQDMLNYSAEILGPMLGVTTLVLGCLLGQLYRFHYRSLSDSEQTVVREKERQAVDNVRKRATALLGTDRIDQTRTYSLIEFATLFDPAYSSAAYRVSHHNESRKFALIIAATMIGVAIISSIAMSATLSGVDKELALQVTWSATGGAAAVSLMIALSHHIYTRWKRPGSELVRNEVHLRERCDAYIDKVGRAVNEKGDDRQIGEDGGRL